MLIFTIRWWFQLHSSSSGTLCVCRLVERETDIVYSIRHLQEWCVRWQVLKFVAGALAKELTRIRQEANTAGARHMVLDTSYAGHKSSPKISKWGKKRGQIGDHLGSISPFLIKKAEDWGNNHGSNPCLYSLMIMDAQTPGTRCSLALIT